MIDRILANTPTIEEREINEVSRLYRALAESFAAILLERLGEQIVCVVLYGSVARGTARPESDIDVFVVAGKTEQEKQPIRREIWKADDEFWDDEQAVGLRERGYRASVETLVVSELQAQRGLPIYLDMTLDAISLHDPKQFFARRMDQARRRMAELHSCREWVGHEEYFWYLKLDAKPGEVFQLPYIEEAQA